MKTIFIFLILVTLSTAQTITGVSTDSIANDSSVIIYGSSFGTGDASLLCFDNFEDGTPSNVLSGTPQIGAWRISPWGHPDPVYTTDQYHSGSQGSAAILTNETGMHSNLEVPTTTMTGTYYFFSWWYRYSYPSDQHGQTKFIQLWGTYQVGDYNPGVMSGGFSGSWWSNYITLENGLTEQQSWIGGAPSMNEWHKCDLILKQSTADVADGAVIIINDCDTVYSRVNYKTRVNADESWDRLLLFYGFTNFTNASLSSYLDDVYVNDSWARVEIGNNSTFGNCTHREIQIPTAWAVGEITITFNKGSFSVDDNVWLFVVDSDGDVSPGYAITIGGAGSGGAPATGDGSKCDVENIEKE